MVIESSYTRFHVSIGWTGVALGVAAIALRVPDFLCFLSRLPQNLQKTVKLFHSIFGGLYLLCVLFMPITANWIWPRYGTPYTIIFLIASMYISIVLGLACIRVHRYLNRNTNILKTENIEAELRKANIDSEIAQQATFTIEEITKHLDNVIAVRPPVKHVWLKYLHAVFMIYSWVMLLGAGQAFLSNSRSNGFPYPDDAITDSLSGRCYGRNLVDLNAPSWLTNLTCGLTNFCQESVKGGPNPYD